MKAEKSWQRHFRSTVKEVSTVSNSLHATFTALHLFLAQKTQTKKKNYQRNIMVISDNFITAESDIGKNKKLF